MGRMLKKELVLAMHPTVPIMALLSAMVLIPNYPYSVTFFYVSLSLFFTCLWGRENNDVVYSMLLPVAKKDVVKGRITLAVLIQLAQMVIMLLLVLLKNQLFPMKNEAGMDAGIALLGVGFLIYGIFNLTFFTGYYRNVKKIGIPFLVSSALSFVVVMAEVICTYAVPFVRDFLDTPAPRFLPEKLIFLGACILLYAVLTLTAYQKSAASFQKQDIQA